jgi:DNA-binding GntR family transcriptional regulator
MEHSGGRAGAICQVLRLAIMEQALEPGTKLPEDTIGEQFGVSRTVVRRALELLASEELIDIRPNRGASVAKPTPQEAHDLFGVRQDIERLVVQRVCGTMTPEKIARLETHIAAEERALHGGRAEYIRLAAEFHVVLAEMSGSQMLARYMRHIIGRSALVLGLYGRPQWSNCSVHEHRDLLGALIDGDLERAYSVMHSHLDSVLSRALETASGAGERGIRDILATYAGALAEA